MLREVLDSTGLDIGDIDWVIPHQTSARAIRKGMAAIGEKLGGAPREPAVVTVDRYGNTASTTHMVALVEELRAGRPRSGTASRCLRWRRASSSVSCCSPWMRALAEPLRAGADEAASAEGRPRRRR